MGTVQHRLRMVAAGEAHERRPVGRRIRRIGICVFFASVAVNAALGIYAVLAPEFGETQGRILATSLCVTGAALLALACEPAWERGLLGPVPYVGAALGAVGFGLVIVGIWTEPESAFFGKAMGSIMITAVGCAAASLLGLGRLVPRHEWVRAAALGLLALGVGLVAILPWLGDEPSEVYLRALGVVLIALAAFAVSVPVLHWIERSQLTVVEQLSDGIRYCPYCGGAVAGKAGTALSCRQCGRKFVVAAPERAASNGRTPAIR